MPSNIVDYGTAQEPNLEEISFIARQQLANYDHRINDSGGPKLYAPNGVRLERTTDKPYTARTVIDVIWTGRKIADLYIILFAPGDATGKTGDYILEQFTEVPSEYRFSTKPERVLPRDKSKEGVLLEACFPLGTFEGKYVHPYTISLEQITVDNVNEPTRLIQGLQIGRNSASYATLVKDHPRSRVTISSESEQGSLELPIYLTCGYRRNGQRFGDPHATFYNPKLAEGHPNLLQVAGFLSAERVDNPLCRVLDSVGIVPE